MRYVVEARRIAAQSPRLRCRAVLLRLAALVEQAVADDGEIHVVSIDQGAGGWAARSGALTVVRPEAADALRDLSKAWVNAELREQGDNGTTQPPDDTRATERPGDAEADPSRNSVPRSTVDRS